MHNSVLLVKPNGQCHGTLTLPGDKSISHRSILLSSLAEGESHVRGFLPSEDCLSTVNAMRALGVNIESLSNTEYRVFGVGLHGLQAPKEIIDCGNAGTLIRLLSGILAGQSFASTLTGDASLQKRPMKRIQDPLRLMGANIDTQVDGTPPISLRPTDALRAVDYNLPVASAQVKSCCLLAALYAEGDTTITEAWPTRDHTERMLQQFSYPIEVKQLSETPYQRKITLPGRGKLLPCELTIPADISHAAFLLVAAAITPNAKLSLKDVGVNPTRTGILQVLKYMGANIRFPQDVSDKGEPIADIHIESSVLKGIELPIELVPLAIDEIPVIAVAATFAEGETIIRGAEELRHKESDRIAATVNAINAAGGRAEALPDGMIIQGQALSGGEIDAVGDHRIAMAFAIASGAASGEITIRNAQAIATSWPDFVETCQKIGLNVIWH